MTYRYESYEKDLIEQSEALIDLAQVLTDKLPSSITGRLAKALPDVIMEEIRSAQRRRDRSLESYEKAAKEQQAAAAADETKRQLLRNQVLCYIPASMKAEIGEDRYDGPFIKGPDFSCSLKNSGGYAGGTKLVVNCNFESRSFPRKKDGTYSVEKAVTFILDQRDTKAAKEYQQDKERERLLRFKALVQPFYKYGVYGTEQTFDVHDGFSLKVKRAYGEEEKYIVWRTVSETVTAEQLQEILKNEVGAVQRDQQEA